MAEGVALRFGSTAAIAGVGGAALVGGLAIGGPGGWLAGVLAWLVAAAAHLGVRHMRRAMPPLPLPTWTTALWAAGLLVTLLQVFRLGALLADPAATWGSLNPDDPRVIHHSCLTSYVHGDTLATLEMDPYDPRYDNPDPRVQVPLPATAAEMAPFRLDIFGYTPAFLVVVRPLIGLAPDFATLRALFSALSALLWAWTLWRLGRHLGGRAQRRLLWLAPLVWGTAPMYLSLQFSNSSIALASVCALAWLGMRGKRSGLAGGALIAFATLTRYTPALLAVIVILRRRWWAMLGGVLGTLVLVGASLVVYGPSPWHHFAHTLLPSMASGDVMRFLDVDELQIAVNVAPFSLPFKLTGLGIGSAGWEEARAIGKAYQVLLVVLTLTMVRARRTERRDLLAWCTLAAMGAIASNFAGPHVQVSTALVLLLLAAEVRTASSVIALAMAWVLLLTMPWPISGPAMLWQGVLQTVVLVGFFTWLVLRGAPWRPAVVEPTA